MADRKAPTPAPTGAVRPPAPPAPPRSTAAAPSCRCWEGTAALPYGDHASSCPLRLQAAPPAPWAEVEAQLSFLAGGRSPGVVYLEPTQAAVILDLVRRRPVGLTDAELVDRAISRMGSL
ncbi:MAG: hypothetical protein AB7I13_00135 [Vicinamibacterales bacterium]